MSVTEVPAPATGAGAASACAFVPVEAGEVPAQPSSAVTHERDRSHPRPFRSSASSAAWNPPKLPLLITEDDVAGSGLRRHALHERGDVRRRVRLDAPAPRASATSLGMSSSSPSGTLSCGSGT